MDFEEHTRSLYCYEDELPCKLTMELYKASFVDGVRLYPWNAVAKQLKTEKDAAHYQIERAIAQLEDADLNYTPEVCSIAASVRAQLQAYMESIK